MKKFLFFISCFNVLLSCGQTNYPKGIYWTQDELKSQTPSQLDELIVEERTSAEMFWGAGNLYRLIDPDSIISRKQLMADVWAYSDGKDLYLNGEKLQLRHWYVKVEHVGRYFLLKANIVGNANYPSRDHRSSATGAVGYAFSTPIYNLIALDPDDYSLIRVNKRIMKKWLERTPDLLDIYKKAKNNSGADVLLKFGILRNEIAAVNAANRE